MSHYQAPTDLRFAPALRELAAPEAQAFLGLKGAAERSNGAVPLKYRELISVAVGLTTQCPYCIDIHTRQALAAGATREELAETVFVAASLRAGASVGHGLLAIRLTDEMLSEQAGEKAMA